MLIVLCDGFVPFCQILTQKNINIKGIVYIIFGFFMNCIFVEINATIDDCDAFQQNVLELNAMIPFQREVSK